MEYNQLQLFDVDRLFSSHFSSNRTNRIGSLYFSMQLER